MAKLFLKNDLLAKFRQYTPDLDIVQFLSTEWRQVIRALEQSYVEVDSQTVGTTNNVLYAVQTATYTTSQNLTFSNYSILGNIGTVTSNYLFNPTTDGKFHIEVSGEWVNVGGSGFPSSNPTYSSSLLIKNQSGTILNTGVFQTSWSGTVFTQDVVPGTLVAIADLTKTNGVYFSCSLNGAYLRNINFKITPISV